MCAICGQFPCDSRCPNAPDPKTVVICEVCKEPIYEGEDMFKLDGCCYHDDCFRDCAVELLMEEYGAEECVARSENYECF